MMQCILGFRSSESREILILTVTSMVISDSCFAEINLRYISVCVNVASPKASSNGPDTRRIKNGVVQSAQYSPAL
jgi:hypothetical protein